MTVPQCGQLSPLHYLRGALPLLGRQPEPSWMWRRAAEGNSACPQPEHPPSSKGSNAHQCHVPGRGTEAQQDGGWGISPTYLGVRSHPTSAGSSNYWVVPPEDLTTAHPTVPLTSPPFPVMTNSNIQISPTRAAQAARGACKAEKQTFCSWKSLYLVMAIPTTTPVSPRGSEVLLKCFINHTNRKVLFHN